MANLGALMVVKVQRGQWWDSGGRDYGMVSLLQKGTMRAVIIICASIMGSPCFTVYTISSYKQLA